MIKYLFSGMKYLFIVFVTLSVLVVILGISFILWSKETAIDSTSIVEVEAVESEEIDNDFPVGVDAREKTITESPAVEWYVESYLSIDLEKPRRHRLINRLLAEISKWDWYQQLASPTSRIIVIYPGERREEITKNIGDILKWNKAERKLFSDTVIETVPTFSDGKFFPGRYSVSVDATPEDIAKLLQERFQTEILARYGSDVEAQVPLKDALIIASLLEREAYDFNDMRYISGVIWNRLFIDMPLQLDASLQYVRGSDMNEPKWWPKIIPNDKYIKSDFNTYKKAGLPPAPIANPSVEAIVAALNPRVTDCMFYFHDSKGGFHCTATYEEHVTNLKKVYGRGS